MSFLRLKGRYVPITERRADMKLSEKEKIFKALGDANRLNIDKLAKRFNGEMQTMVQEIYATFERSHANSFNAWMNSLIDTVIENMLGYVLNSPFTIIPKQVKDKQLLLMLQNKQKN